MYYSIIVAAYRRADEITEFLTSLIDQKYRDFEVIISDGSPDDALQSVVAPFEKYFKVKYVFRQNFGASESRNVGCEYAEGDYLIFIDSDCIIPENYLQNINDFLKETPVDAFGGPDKAHSSFTPVMKAINYAMTSFLTSGGIRGKKRRLGKFLMRGFNMGFTKEVFQKTGGFNTMQVAEDIELSVRIYKAGFKAALIPDAYVYHKRKSTLKKFVKQLHMHGKGRIDLFLRHKDQLKLIHLLPSAYSAYLVFLLALLILDVSLFTIASIPLVLYIFALFIDAYKESKNLKVTLLSVWASLLMLPAYGTGLIRQWIYRMVLGKKRESVKSVVLKH